MFVGPVELVVELALPLLPFPPRVVKVAPVVDLVDCLSEEDELTVTWPFDVSYVYRDPVSEELENVSRVLNEVE